MGALSHSALRTPHLFVRSAFTLIELLVVVAIISLLMAMLMPTLSRARELVRSVMCASNEKTIGVGFSMYAAAWNDLIPPVGSAAYTVPDGVDPAWNYNLGRAGYLGLAEQYKYKTKGGSISTTYRSRYPVAHCAAEGSPVYPFMNVDSQGQSINFYDTSLGGSYIMNWSVSCNRYGTWVWFAYPPEIWQSVYRPGWSQGSPYYPSSAAMIVTDIEDIGTASSGVRQGLPYYAREIDWLETEYLDVAVYYVFRHPDNKANFLFMDGHVGPKKHFKDTGQELWQYLWTQQPPSRR